VKPEYWCVLFGVCYLSAPWISLPGSLIAFVSIVAVYIFTSYLDNEKKYKQEQEEICEEDIKMGLEMERHRRIKEIEDDFRSKRLARLDEIYKLIPRQHRKRIISDVIRERHDLGDAPLVDIYLSEETYDETFKNMVLAKLDRMNNLEPLKLTRPRAPIDRDYLLEIK